MVQGGTRSAPQPASSSGTGCTTSRRREVRTRPSTRRSSRHSGTCARWTATEPGGWGWTTAAKTGSTTRISPTWGTGEGFLNRIRGCGATRRPRTWCRGSWEWGGCWGSPSAWSSGGRWWRWAMWKWRQAAMVKSVGFALQLTNYIYRCR